MNYLMMITLAIVYGGIVLVVWAMLTVSKDEDVDHVEVVIEEDVKEAA